MQSCTPLCISISHAPSLSHTSDQESLRHAPLFSFQPSDLSDAVTDIKWSPTDSNVWISHVGRQSPAWNVGRMDPIVAHDIEAEFTPEEANTIAEAEADLEKRNSAKLSEKQQNDPLLQLAMSMKQQRAK